MMPGYRIDPEDCCAASCNAGYIKTGSVNCRSPSFPDTVDFPAVKPIIAAGICYFNVFLTILIIFSITYIQGVRLLDKPTELFVILYKKSRPELCILRKLKFSKTFRNNPENLLTKASQTAKIQLETNKLRRKTA